MILITPLDAWIKRAIHPRGTPKALTRADIERFQLERINLTVAHAREKSPFYRQRLRGPGDGSLTRLEDLSTLPFTTPDDISRDPLQFLCGSQSEIERVVTLRSSATTGPPKRVFFTADDLESTIDFFHHGMSTLVRPGDRTLILMPGEAPASIGALLRQALARMDVQGLLHGPIIDPAQTVKFIRDRAVNSLVAAPTQALALARAAGTDALAGRIQSVLLSTDYLSQAVTRALEEAWGCEVFDHYGMTEMGWGGGVECAAHQGYHLREADLYVEIVDPRTGEPLGEDETGEVVFTTLNRRGIPLIRYRTGDVARFIPGPCPCGTALKTLSRVGCRLDGLVEVAPGFTLSMAQLDETLFSLPGVVDFNVELSGRAGARELSLEVARNRDDKRPESAHALAERLASIPCLGAALDSGELKINAIRFRDAAAFPREFRKRRIVVRP